MFWVRWMTVTSHPPWVVRRYTPSAWHVLRAGSYSRTLCGLTAPALRIDTEKAPEKGERVCTICERLLSIHTLYGG